jgi:mannitol/fructose-specific phosphotransferase system IIA component (Ntr-type)
MEAPNPKYLISSLVTSGGVVLTLKGTTQTVVLSELVASVPNLGNRPEDQQKLLQALLDREAMHSTGIGDGVALPHARNSLGDLVTQAHIVFGRHPHGLAYGAIDGKPVRLFFLLVTTAVTQHLQILARISRLLRDGRLRDALLTAASGPDVIQAIRRAEEAL